MHGAQLKYCLAGGCSNSPYKLDYISVPILAKFYATQGLSFGIGPQEQFMQYTIYPVLDSQIVQKG